MSLQDYVVRRDKFEHDDDNKYEQFAFPCCVCKHRKVHFLNEPCRTCDHNINAEED